MLMGLFFLNMIDKYQHLDIGSFIKPTIYILLFYVLKTQITSPVSDESFMWNCNGDNQILIRKFSMINCSKKDLTLMWGAR